MTYMLRNDVMVTAGKLAEFEARNARLSNEVNKGQPGFQRANLFKSFSTPAKYIRSTMWDSREASNAALGSEELRAFLAANPAAGLVTPNRPQEGYELVHTVGDRIPPSAPLSYQTMLEFTIDNRPGNAAAF